MARTLNSKQWLFEV